MRYMPGFNRRSFMVATAVGAGFALGLSLPSKSDALYAADGLPEVDAWEPTSDSGHEVVDIAEGIGLR